MTKRLLEEKTMEFMMKQARTGNSELWAHEKPPTYLETSELLTLFEVHIRLARSVLEALKTRQVNVRQRETLPPMAIFLNSLIQDFLDYWKTTFQPLQVDFDPLQADPLQSLDLVPLPD